MTCWRCSIAASRRGELRSGRAVSRGFERSTTALRCVSMLETPHSQTSARPENSRLREELKRLRAENERLRAENQALRSTLDAHIARGRSTSLFGPLEMSAGTSVGPRRRD